MFNKSILCFILSFRFVKHQVVKPNRVLQADEITTNTPGRGGLLLFKKMTGPGPQPRKASKKMNYTFKVIQLGSSPKIMS